MEWDESDRGRTTHQYIPRIAERLRTRLSLDRHVVQAMTGHGDFAARLFSFNLAGSDRCLCGQEETGDHVIWDCLLYNEERQEYMDLLQVPREAIIYSSSYFKEFKRLVTTILLKKKEEEQLFRAI